MAIVDDRFNRPFERVNLTLQFLDVREDAFPWRVWSVMFGALLMRT